MESRGQFKEAYDTWKRAGALFNDPEELRRANRKISSLEKKIGKRDEDRKKKEKEEEED